MQSFDEVEEIFRRLDNGTCTENDKQVLLQRLLLKDPALVSQLGKYNISIAEGREIHIGDRVTIEFNDQAAKQVVEVLRQSGLRLDSSVYQDLEVLETVHLDSGLVEAVNHRLNSLEDLRDQAQLSGNQKIELQDLQKKVRTINDLNQKLKTIERQATRLLYEVQSALDNNLQDLKNESYGLVQHQHIENLSNQREVLKKFIVALKDGSRASQWVSQSASQLKRTAIKRALNQFPEIRTAASIKDLNDFEFSIEQFLEQVTHALEWGDHSIFDNSEISLIFDSAPLYIAVFQHVKTMMHGSSLPPEAIEQIAECLDDLLNSFVRLY
jgi:Effector-associated domain 10